MPCVLTRFSFMSQVQRSHALRLDQIQLHVPSSLESNGHMQQCAQENVLLNDVGRHAETSPIQTHVEVAIAVEVIRTLEDVQISDCMNNNEEDQEDCASRQSLAIVLELNTRS